MPQRTREIHLAARPEGEPKPSDFDLAEVDVPDPGEGELLVRNTWMSVDPYMRGRMNDAQVLRRRRSSSARRWRAARSARSSRPRPTALRRGRHRACTSSAGASTRSSARRSRAQVDAGARRRRLPRRARDAGPHRLRRAARHRRRCARATSSSSPAPRARSARIAGQIAKLRGHRVIGSAGSPEKVALPDRRARLRRRVQLPRRPGRRAAARRPRRTASTSTSTTSAASTSRRRSARCDLHGRVAMCGAISQLQRDRAGARPAQPRADRRQAADAARLHRQRPRATACGDFVARGRRAGCADGPTSSSARRSSTAARARAAGVHRPAARRQHGQDAGAAVAFRRLRARRGCRRRWGWVALAWRLPVLRGVRSGEPRGAPLLKKGRYPTQFINRRRERHASR